MDWNYLIWFGLAASLCWAAGAVMSFVRVGVGSGASFSGKPSAGTDSLPSSRNPNPGSTEDVPVSRRRVYAAAGMSLCGSLIFLAFIVGLWISLERPPLRTVGETRLWYSFFVSLSGVIVYLRWRYRWILPFSTMMAVVFLCINLFRPEIHDRSLMPALQSVWFVPHVVVYMFAYALLGAVTLFALYLWLRPSGRVPSDAEMGMCDNMVRVGWSFLTLGMVMGALWAKQAWGDWWTWDPKETWAAATWLSYLLYLHLRAYASHGRIISSPDIQGRAGCPVSGSAPHVSHDLLFALLVFSFILLQMCWYGINYLPSAKGASIHVY